MTNPQWHIARTTIINSLSLHDNNSIVNISCVDYASYLRANSIRPMAILTKTQLISHFALVHPDYVRRWELFSSMLVESFCRWTNNECAGAKCQHGSAYIIFFHLCDKRQKHHDDEVFVYAIEKYTDVGQLPKWIGSVFNQLSMPTDIPMANGQIVNHFVQE